VQHIDREQGGVVGTFNPLQPRYAFRENDIGDVSYSLAMTNPQVTRDAFAPKRTDFRLQVSRDGAAWHDVMGGFHWPVGINNEEGTVQIQGMDWTAFLDQPMWFDAYDIDAEDLVFDESDNTYKKAIKAVLNNPNAWFRGWTNLPAGANPSPYITFDATQEIVVQELVDSVADGNFDTLKIDVEFLGEATGWSTPMSYVVMFQDSTTILDHIKAIAALDDPFGFDFYMEPDKKLICYNPALTAPLGSINALYVIKRDSPALVSAQWQNQGPVATHTVGIGPGSPGVWAHKTYAPSKKIYRRWLRLVTLGGSYRMPKQVKYAVDQIPDRFPHKDLKLTLKPDELDPVDPTAFFFPAIGRALYVDIDYPPYHRINANFWITAQEFHTDDAGNWLCDVSLQQIYDPTGVG
jgi:hypothetical protein